MSEKLPIAVAHGNGIGPEIIEVALEIMKEAGAPLEIHPVEIGEKVYMKGITTGIEPKTWDTIRNCKAFFKAPITTPQGGGFKSLNVTCRTTLGLYANIRPCISYTPFIDSKHPNMDVVIIRENEEDLYVGVEYRQSAEVQKSIKMISSPGSEKIIRYAFEYAKAHKRKKVTAFTKDNILKISDGHFHKIFDEVATEYPDIENEHWIIDIGAAKLADTPEAFDVIVMPNLYGDIVSDIGAQISGSVGLVGTANIGEHGAMFEAIHGSAPRRANQNMANPSAMILASVLMMDYLDLPEIGALIHNAWLKTVEDGIHTYDVYVERKSKEKVGTKEFGQAVIERLGKKPSKLKEAIKHDKVNTPKVLPNQNKKCSQELVGVDVYINAPVSQEEFLPIITSLNLGKFEVKLVTNRGTTIYPEGQPETYCIDQWRVRIKLKEDEHAYKPSHTYKILEILNESNLDVISIEHLYNFDGSPGYSSSNY
ncbi:MAG: NADP-dependent isocitrate dehydrogenase [Rhabdochlamydiaceae bacterium]|nr:NADP-dependent isocitrate dehydrogenase [Candidatus Amphrikana amoebophyrae]